MVQLMAYFALAYSFNLEDKSKAFQMLQSIREALGVEAKVAEAKGEGILPGQLGIAPERAADLEKLMTDLKATTGPEEGRRMRIVSFRGSLLFEEGSDSVSAEFLPLMNRMAELVKDYPGFQMICEGHAAPGERGRGGSDALDLSGLRAQAAVRFLVARGADPKTLAAEARSDAIQDGEPSSPEGRALQRRVNFRFQRVAER